MALKDIDVYYISIPLNKEKCIPLAIFLLFKESPNGNNSNHDSLKE